MNYFRIVVAIFLGLCSCIVAAQSGAEARELNPEELDAAFTEQDAAREAAGWSDEVIDYSVTDPLGNMTDAADLIILGSVESQSVVYDANGVPFTHTTFTVSNALKGDFTSDQFTLIQEGGPSQTEGGPSLMVSTSRYFNVGEDELLFLQQGSDEQKASVQFRFRILGGQVYDEDGRGVIVEELAPGGHKLLLTADRNPDKRFSQIQIGSATLRKKIVEDDATFGPTDEGRNARGASRSYTDSSNVSTLSAAITN